MAACAAGGVDEPLGAVDLVGPREVERWLLLLVLVVVVVVVVLLLC
jgi:hypothetical protein